MSSFYQLGRKFHRSSDDYLSSNGLFVDSSKVIILWKSEVLGDVSIILGKSQKQAERILRDIKFALNKELSQYVTMQEFAEYTGIPLEDVRASCI